MPPSARHTSNSEAVYLQRLTPVLEWVHAHPALPLSLQQAAGLSHFSKFHFQRIFTAVIGESLSQYSNRVRLEGAANRLLLAEHDSVTEIALRYGFSGSANFSRAFKEHFGVTPSSVRKTEQLKKLVATSHIEPALNTTQLTRIHSLRTKSEETIQPVKVIEVPEQLLCTLRATKGYQLDGINDCWQRLASWADEQGINYLQVPKFGFGHDNPVFTPMDKARYDGAIVITEKQKSAVTAPYKLTRLSPGTYAIFGYRGTIKNLLSFQLDIFAQWLPHSGYEPTNMPLVEHYPEVLEEQHGKPPSEHFIVLEIWLQVQPLRDTHLRFER